MAKLLLIDDDAQLTEALVTALERHEFEITVVHSAREGVESARAQMPDLVILDLNLPDRDGVSVISEVRESGSVPVLILSGATDEQRRVEALEAGADDFLQKPFGVDELTARIKAVLRRSAGEVEQQPTVLCFGPLTVDLEVRTVTRDEEEIRLTPKEWRLMELFVAHPSRLLTHNWLLGEVWGTGHGEETRAALRAHVRSLRAKLADDANQPFFLRTESGSGYRWIAPVGADAAPPDSDDEAPDEMGTTDLVHELNNALTAMRVATFVLKSRSAPAEGSHTGAVDISARVDEIVTRVSSLAVELEARVTKRS